MTGVIVYPGSGYIKNPVPVTRGRASYELKKYKPKTIF